jgi:ABC-type hemin transport system substrate-binding protein
MSRRQIDRIVKLAGGINKLQSFREPTPLDKQSVILMNRDTLYSFAIVDISKGAKLTMPEADVR